MKTVSTALLSCALVSTLVAQAPAQAPAQPAGQAPAAAGAAGAAARGGRAAGPAAPAMSPDQTVAVGSMTQLMQPLQAAVTQARAALNAASLKMPRDQADISAKADAVSKADLALATAHSEAFDRIQKSANRLNAEQKAPIVATAGRGGGGGRAAGANPGGVGPDNAKAQTAKLVTATGVAATLFASEPMIVNPISMVVDERGRIWTTEGANYRGVAYTRPEGDRVMMLEDTNRDGVADKSTVFYQDRTINSALGLAVLGNRVYVTASPYLYILTDTNNDGVADKRQVMLEDSSNGNHDHGFHAIHFGPDGKLYLNFGNSVPELRRPVGGLLDVPLHGTVPAHPYETVVDVDGKEVKNGPIYRGGMALRSNLDGSNVEVLGHNFRNNFELAVDSFGRLWQSDNDDDGNQAVRIVNIMEHGNYGFQDEITGAAWRTAWVAAGSDIAKRGSMHWHEQDPGAAPTMLITGAGSPTGITVYEGTLLPAAFQGQVLHTDARPSAARAYPTTKVGAGFTAKIENLLTPAQGEDWYRPSDVTVAPDGSVYVADWNDSVVGGHALADQVLATDTGRIYRLAPAGRAPTVPTLNVTTAAGAVAALQSPNEATMYLGWTSLKGMPAATAEAELTKLWQQRGTDDHTKRMRARALYLLSQMNGGARYISQALEDREEEIRIAALHAAKIAGMDTIPYARQLARDPSPMVRREVAVSLWHKKDAAVPQIWATLASQHDGKDRWYLEALGIGADGRWDEVLTAWQAAKADTTSPAALDIIWRSRGNAKTPALVSAVLAAPGTTPEVRTRFLRTMDYVSGPEKDAALLKMLTP